MDKMWKKLILTPLLIFQVLLLGLLSQSLPVSTYTESDQDFDPSLTFTEREFHSLPSAFSSAKDIQNFLESKGSFLATYLVDISFDKDDDILFHPKFKSLPDILKPSEVLKPYLGKKMLVSEFIWKLSRESLGNGCGITLEKLCINNQELPLNPAIIIGTIQKESGLIYGKNSKLEPNSEESRFLLDRAMGYYCFETEDKSKSCFDENPEWKFYKGFFRQVYYSSRLLRLRSLSCEQSVDKVFIGKGGFFQVGRDVVIDGEQIFLENSITCGLYIYTPHISAQSLLRKIILDIKGLENFLEIHGTARGYQVLI